MIPSVDTTQWRSSSLISHSVLSQIWENKDQINTKLDRIQFIFFFNTDVTTTHSEERLEYSGFLFQIVVQT